MSTMEIPQELLDATSEEQVAAARETAASILVFSGLGQLMGFSLPQQVAGVFEVLRRKGSQGAFSVGTDAELAALAVACLRIEEEADEQA